MQPIMNLNRSKKIGFMSFFELTSSEKYYSIVINRDVQSKISLDIFIL